MLSSAPLRRFVEVLEHVALWKMFPREKLEKDGAGGGARPQCGQPTLAIGERDDHVMTADGQRAAVARRKPDVVRRPLGNRAGSQPACLCRADVRLLLCVAGHRGAGCRLGTRLFSAGPAGYDRQPLGAHMADQILGELGQQLSGRRLSGASTNG